MIRYSRPHRPSLCVNCDWDARVKLNVTRVIHTRFAFELNKELLILHLGCNDLIRLAASCPEKPFLYFPGVTFGILDADSIS